MATHRSATLRLNAVSPIRLICASCSGAAWARVPPRGAGKHAQGLAQWPADDFRASHAMSRPQFRIATLVIVAIARLLTKNIRMRQFMLRNARYKGHDARSLTVLRLSQGVPWHSREIG